MHTCIHAYFVESLYSPVRTEQRVVNETPQPVRGLGRKLCGGRQGHRERDKSIIVLNKALGASKRGRCRNKRGATTDLVPVMRDGDPVNCMVGIALHDHARCVARYRA